MVHVMMLVTEVYNIFIRMKIWWVDQLLINTQVAVQSELDY